MDLGLKLWSINTDYYFYEALKLFESQIYDYIELYVVPNSLEQLGKWKIAKNNHNIPFIIHCPHFAHGFNLSKPDKRGNNIKIYQEVKKYADELEAKYIIFHGGIDGKIEETAKQLASFNEPRALIENKPYVALSNRMGGEFCRGYNIDEIKLVKETANCGFCLDFGHAICAANSLYDMKNPSNEEKKYPPLEGGSKSLISGRGYNETILNYAKQLRQNQTNAENILWQILKNKQLYGLKFRRQQPIGQYIADFVCFDKKIIIELDGSGHLLDSQKNHDVERDKFLSDNGFKVVRVNNNDVYNNLEGVVDYILNHINPSPQPSPSRGEGEKLYISSRREGETIYIPLSGEGEKIYIPPSGERENIYPPLEGGSKSLISGMGL